MVLRQKLLRICRHENIAPSLSCFWSSLFPSSLMKISISSVDVERWLVLKSLKARKTTRPGMTLCRKEWILSSQTMSYWTESFCFVLYFDESIYVGQEIAYVSTINNDQLRIWSSHGTHLSAAWMNLHRLASWNIYKMVCFLLSPSLSNLQLTLRKVLCSVRDLSIHTLSYALLQQSMVPQHLSTVIKTHW